MPKGPAPSGGLEDAVRWARSLLAEGDFVVLDSETTGLGTPIDFVEVGVVYCRGETLFDSPMCPSCPVEPGASRVHGRTTESLAGERRFHEVYPDLLEALWGKRVVVYNAPYDRRVWDAAVGRLGARAALAGELAPWECAMRAYAAYVGERSKGGGYKSQKLAGGDHTAIGDARATLALIERMARGARSGRGTAADGVGPGPFSRRVRPAYELYGHPPGGRVFPPARRLRGGGARNRRLV